MHVVCIVGPPAVGKMTVGRAVGELTGYRLFHNHMSIEPLLGIFEFGTPSFDRINSMIRREVLRESVVAGLPGLVFSFAWDFDNPSDAEAVDDLIEPVVTARQPVDFVELYAPQAVRLAREGGPDRMDHKRSKRDVEWARAHVVAMERRSRFNSLLDPLTGEDDWPLPHFRHLRLDNAHNAPEVTARRIVAELDLPTLPTPQERLSPPAR